MDCIK
jgi:hypothetical protein